MANRQRGAQLLRAIAVAHAPHQTCEFSLSSHRLDTRLVQPSDWANYSHRPPGYDRSRLDQRQAALCALPQSRDTLTDGLNFKRLLQRDLYKECLTPFQHFALNKSFSKSCAKNYTLHVDPMFGICLLASAATPLRRYMNAWLALKSTLWKASVLSATLASTVDTQRER